MNNDLLKARDLLLAGDVVGIPTETVYGLAASIKSEAGLRRIFSLKERPFFDPLIVHVDSFKQAQSLVTEWPPLTDFLARTFWPGPLTIILEKAAHVNSLITSGLSTVAIRQPAHPIASELIRIVGHPIAAPSANKFGRTSPSKASHVRDEFGEDLKLVLDGDDCEVGVESTVVALNGNNEIHILRPGGITREMLEAACTRWSTPTNVIRHASAASPGSLKHHYMPRIPLIILAANSHPPAEFKNPAELKLNTDPSLAARELYSEMRRLSETGADALYIFKPTIIDGLEVAIWDRLTRAATSDLS